MEITGERFIPGWEGVTKLEHLNRYYFVANQIDLKDKDVLDIASGEGYGSNILSHYAQSVIGVDISNEAVEHAKVMYTKRNLKYLQGDAAKIPLEDKSVDVVVSFETIEHHDKHKEMMTEIKRVLKTDGILIISSPDKYYYSDVPNYKNEFHVKELYYKEFKELINKYFNKTFYYSQKTFVGSIIALDENKLEYKKPVVIAEEGAASEFYPMYNIAIGTDDVKFVPNNQLIFYKEFDEILTSLDIQNAIKIGKQLVYQTKAYQFGRFILTPFSLIKKKK